MWDRRQHGRVKVLLPCFWLTSPETQGWRIGVTENVSRNGLLIRWNPEPPGCELPGLGNWMVVGLKWPLNRAGEQKFLICGGRVLRIDRSPGNGAVLVAVEVARMSFRNNLLGGRRFAPCLLTSVS